MLLIFEKKNERGKNVSDSSIRGHSHIRNEYDTAAVDPPWSNDNDT